MTHFHGVVAGGEAVESKAAVGASFASSSARLQRDHAAFERVTGDGYHPAENRCGIR